MSAPTPEQRFWAKVNKRGGRPPAAPRLGECWLWTAAVDRWGYGSFWLGKRCSAHRVSYELNVGPIPNGLEVDHRCHREHCVRPTHLRLATRQQNAEHLNGATRRNNATGIRGVTRDNRRRLWRAQVVHQGRIYVKRFQHIADAEQWVVAKRNEVYSHNDLDRRSA